MISTDTIFLRIYELFPGVNYDRLFFDLISDIR